MAILGVPVKTCMKVFAIHTDIRMRGFSLVELVVAIGIFALLASGVTHLVLGDYQAFTGKSNAREIERLADDVIEVLDVIKENSWTEVATTTSGSVYIYKKTNEEWALGLGTETIGAFTRDIRVASLYREPDNDVSESSSGNTLDPSMVKVTVTISATGRANYVYTSYLSNWEAYRMRQNNWGGSWGDTSWDDGQDDYNTSTNIYLATTTEIVIAPSNYDP